MNWQAKYPQEFKLPYSWHQLPQGEAYCNAITDYFAPWLAKISGYQLVKIGGLSAEISCDLPLRHQIILCPELSPALIELNGQDAVSVLQARLDNLPFIENSVNACLLANGLNFYHDPHQLLREITRVLDEEGYLFISLFNPCSPLLFKRRLGLPEQRKFEFRHYIIYRLIDWLELLGFEILAYRHLSVAKKNAEKAPLFSPLSVLVAQKRSLPLTLNPAKNIFRQHKGFEPMGAFKQINNDL
ncbi:class I SAM-dependent methyltransferase [Mesocricetibacter intestinalis]|uniref:class I SAM-dependent methyltransferase n=1 Tax=Mesocricetibacter intestinalis TaxID=1521930 RepID=UPI00105DBCC8